MSKQILIMGLLILANIVSAFAGENTLGPAGICSKIKTDLTKKLCLRIVQKADFFDGRALKICDQMKPEHLILDCIDSTYDRRYVQSSIEFCNKIDRDDKLLSNACLSILGNREYSEFDLTQCSSFKFVADRLRCINNQSFARL